MKHIILVGACYLDTILSVPFFPTEDSKLRATSLATRRGGNCPNALQVLQQLLRPPSDVQLHLLSVLPGRYSSATRSIASSFAGGAPVDLSYCVYRESHDQAASSYILRSEATGTRTLVSYNDLPEMTVAEFEGVISAFRDDETWWHFEGRMPEITIQCIHHLRNVLPSASISVEIEKPARDGLTDLAAQADIVFYSRSWAEDRGHASPESCLTLEEHPRARLALCTWGSEGAAALSRPSDECFRWPAERATTGEVAIVVDAVGAGDTFIAGTLYGLLCHDDPEHKHEHEHGGYWDDLRKLSFAVTLATLKVQQEGFDGLDGAAAAAAAAAAAITAPVSRGTKVLQSD